MKLSIIYALVAATAQATHFFETSPGDAVLLKLGELGANLVDSAGAIQESAFDHWDESELKAWLESHKLSKKDVQETHEELLKRARKNKELLRDDVTSFSQKAQGEASNAFEDGVEHGKNAASDAADKAQDATDKVKSAAENAHAAAAEAGQRFVSKGKEFYEQTAKGVIGIWSNTKLKDYLNDRNIKYAADATHEQLVSLVESAKDSPVVTGTASWFEGWSREDLTDALKRVGENIEGSRKELVDRVQKAYADSVAKGHETAEQANKHAASNLPKWKDAMFDRWSFEDLKEYVEDFGDKAASTKDELAKQAKSHFDYFTAGLKPKSKKTPADWARVAQVHITDHLKSQWSRLHSAVNYISSEVLGLTNYIKGEV